MKGFIYMRDLNKLREELNSIDDEMKKLFVKRMNTIKEVALYKKENNLAIFDEKREASMKERLSKDVEEVKEEYLNFLNAILIESKNYQKKVIK